MINIKSSKRSFSLPHHNQVDTKSNENIDTYISVKASAVNFDTLRVVIRVRPPIQREIEEGLPFRSIALVSKDGKSCSLAEYMGVSSSEIERQKEWVENSNLFQMHHFTFDNAFDIDSSQNDVYIQTAKPAVLSILEGYNSTILAYGQTGTGKTFTMEGFTYSNTDPKRGIIPRSIEEVFNYIESFSNNNTKFMVRASYLQIYNESVSDLLKIDRGNLQIREDKKKGVFVDGLSEWAVRNPSDIYSLLQKGSSCRETSSTKMNDVSSRSHAVFVIIVEQMTITTTGNKNESKTQIKIGKLNLVDLAGSERIKNTGSTGKQLEEGKKINKSLSALGNVINALTDTKNRGHIPYRDSKLTRLLEDSLGGNCKTTMMAMISPSAEFFSETLSTLNFAKRAKNIKNRPKINEDIDHKALIREYEVELKKLRCELDEKNRLIHSNELVIQLDEQRKRAEEDKQAAIVALEQASRQYLQEREEKKKLEQKIKIMNSQMITGGHKGEDQTQLKLIFEEKHTKLIKEFDNKLLEVEKERQIIEEEKSQVERYKLLLLKQRDIMIALTSKLNERDENILQLQEEIEASEKIIRELEENVESNNYKIEIMENFIKKNGLKMEELTLNRTNTNGSKVTSSKKSQNEKMYVPFHVENYEKEYENSPTILLNSEEKIKELNNILKEQEKEIDIMKMISSKIMKNSNNPDFLNSINFLEFKELQNKYYNLEKEKAFLEKDVKEKGKDSYKIDKLKNNIKPILENLLHNIKMGRNNDIKSIENEIKRVYHDIETATPMINLKEESELKINFDSGKIDRILTHENLLIKNTIDKRQPTHYFKNLPTQYNLDNQKEKISKTKSVTPLRVKNYDKSEYPLNNNAIATNNIKTTDNKNIYFDTHKSTSGLNNNSNKSIIEATLYENIKSNNTSMNSSGLNVGIKKTDLNKFLNFNK